MYIEQERKIDNMIEKTCREKNTTLYKVQKADIKNVRFEKQKYRFDYKQYRDIELNLRGKKQVQNASLVLNCCEILNKKGYDIPEEAIRKGLETVIHRGRFEIMHESPTIIFDGGHNEEAIKNLRQTVDMCYKEFKKIYVISVLKSKDYQKVLDNLLEETSIFIFTNGNDSKRYTDCHTMYQYAKQKNDSIEMYEMELENAVQFCKEKIDYVSFIIGSFYIYGSVKKILEV